MATGFAKVGSLAKAIDDAAEAARRGRAVPIGLGAAAAGASSEDAEAGMLDVASRSLRTGIPRRNVGGERGSNRGQRRTVPGRLTPEERSAISSSVEGSGMSEKEAVKLVSDWKTRHPKSEWAAPDMRGIKFDKETGKPQLDIRQTPYNFHIDPGTGKESIRGGGHFNKIADGVAQEIIDIAQRAKSGDVSAQRIMDNAGWYQNVESRLMNEYGSFAELTGDLLGATSPNTPVATNFKFAKDILGRASRGDFDKKMDGFADTLDRRHALLDETDQIISNRGAQTIAQVKQTPEYTAKIAEAKQLSQKLQSDVNTIKQANGKNYGINSYNAMVALADRWRVIRKGSAPKAKNFSGNLTGFSDAATIDVWAARNLRRHAGLKPIPSAAEKGVSGKVTDPENFRSGQEFGFGQDVLEVSTQKINDALGLDLQPRDVQALQWFAEKDLWTRNGWTSPAGEGGSFETMLDLDPVESLAVGTSRTQSVLNQGRDFIPSEVDQLNASNKFLGASAIDLDVLAAKSKSSQGLFFGEPEKSLDVDVISREDTVPATTLDEIAKQADADDQEAFFVARRAHPDVGKANPEKFQVGAEAYFNTPITADDATINKMSGFLEDRGVPGFTMIKDPRETGDKVIGVRYIDIPQFTDPEKFAKMTPQEYAEYSDATFQKYGQLGRDLKANFPNVKTAAPSHFDVNVKSREATRDYVAQLQNPQRDPDLLHQEFWGFKPATTRFKEFTGEVAPFYKRGGGGVEVAAKIPQQQGFIDPKVFAPIAGAGALGTVNQFNLAPDLPSETDLLEQDFQTPVQKFRETRAAKKDGFQQFKDTLLGVGETAATIGSAVGGGIVGDLSRLGGFINPFSTVEETEAGAQALQDKLQFIPSENAVGLDAIGAAAAQAEKEINQMKRLLKPEDSIPGQIFEALPERVQGITRVLGENLL